MIEQIQNELVKINTARNDSNALLFYCKNMFQMLWAFKWNTLSRKMKDKRILLNQQTVNALTYYSKGTNSPIVGFLDFR